MATTACRWVVIATLMLGPLLVGAKPKVIMDTDAGADDAYALAMLIAADTFGEIDFIAITTVSGNTGVNNVSSNVLKVLDTAQRLDIPVYRGAEFALIVTPASDNYFGYDGFGDFDYPNAPNASSLQPDHAAIALVNYASQYPGEIILICIGPLTNLALAERLDPKLASRLLRVVILGGAVSGIGNVKPGVEFNFYFDAEAAFIVVNTTYNNDAYLLPWETVLNARLPMEWRTDVLGNVPGPMMELLDKAEAKALPNYGDLWHCADGIAAALVLDQSFAQAMEHEFVEIEIVSPKLSGATIVDYSHATGNQPNVLIVKSVNATRFQQMLIRYISSYASLL